MIRLTKVFHFETAHAIHGYDGKCKNIHGHSYELHVTICGETPKTDFIPAPGFIVDFKEIKQAGQEVLQLMDHKIVLSETYLTMHPELKLHENLVIWDYEPTAENILLHIKRIFDRNLPATVKPVHLKLYETKDSYAEWLAD
ncbi:MAG TPA: 6-carboxytetrahydropterin synthase [Niabella sp.]|nr:6-carboxytetrahydropterin synthase [Niabella sp.]HOZ95626.1 6-carboxytetrahydropterin synthase [Niabella sp.]HQW13866.1 6-carboxytetrahydropterin synthase [Niabella sp.]HQX19241.1 6-carboxytetrahydropterin synthase [Niabella sp.]HQX41040.1 6-carboxytetrahydropterin synthase [Niabella sp.]